MISREEAKRVLEDNKAAYAITDAYIAWWKDQQPKVTGEFSGRVKTGDTGIILANLLCKLY